jgi:hypothetical protein
MPSCGVIGVPPLTGEGIGDLRIGATVSSVKRKCRVLRDTVVLASEGMKERVLYVDLRRDTVRAYVNDDKIWRVHLNGSLFRTADSLGVGTTVGTVRDRPGLEAITGEGFTFFTIPEHCGISFRLGGIAPGTKLSRIPNSTRVVEVLMFGCKVGGKVPS